MKNLKVVIVLISTFALIIGLSACGDNTASSGQQSDTQVTTVQETEKQTEVVEQVMPSPDQKASADNLVGNWVGIDSPDFFVKITKTDAGYEYEDNEGKYTATFVDGVLKVQVGDNDTADVYINPETGHLLTSYQENTSEYSKK